LIEHNSATSLQVTATALAGMIWAMENPRRGIVEPDEVDWERVLQIADPYCVPYVSAPSPALCSDRVLFAMSCENTPLPPMFTHHHRRRHHYHHLAYTAHGMSCRVIGQYTDWNPLVERETLFAEDLDKTDKWQFKNFRVV
jgi:homospermidine synthase